MAFNIYTLEGSKLVLRMTDILYGYSRLVPIRRSQYNVGFYISSSMYR